MIEDRFLPSDAGSSCTQIEFAFNHEPTLDELHDVYIARLLDLHDGNRLKIAKTLGISERKLYRLFKKLE